MTSLSSVRAQSRLVQLSKALDRAEYRGSDGQIRHKCFLSYHAEDASEVLVFVESAQSVLIPRAIGVSDDSPFIDSTNNDYIMDKIRDDYLADSTVTIVLVGRCTWARKFVDWEVYSSLRKDRVNRLNGLLALELPSAAATGAKLPARVLDNVTRDANNDDTGYGRYYKYPTSTAALQLWVEDAFKARSSRASLITNKRLRRTINSACV